MESKNCSLGFIVGSMMSASLPCVWFMRLNRKSGGPTEKLPTRRKEEKECERSMLAGLGNPKVPILGYLPPSAGDTKRLRSLLAGLGNLVDTDGQHRDDIDDQEAPADRAVALGNQAGQTEGGDRNADERQADGDHGTDPGRGGFPDFLV